MNGEKRQKANQQKVLKAPLGVGVKTMGAIRVNKVGGLEVEKYFCKPFKSTKSLRLQARAF
jgi:hypothetical protein